ncbi:NADH dehydrogenase 1 alpha subcomplex [Tylopilus felleus]
MPLPWEALIPFGLLTTMFAAAGTLLNTSKRAQSQGKTRLDLQPVRYNIDAWDEMMMDRDKRLTGHIRGQKSDPTSPEGFDTSSAWYTQQTS